MAYLVSLATLSERVLQRANLEGASRFIKPYELTDLINGSIAEWVDEVRGTTWNGSYMRSSHEITTTSGIRLYPMPQDYLSLISVDIATSADGLTIAVPSYQEEERSRLLNMTAASCTAIHYQIQQTDISLLPIPQGEHVVTVNYVPTAPVLADPQDTIDSLNGWEEFIVLDSAIKCLMKVGSTDVIPLLEQRLNAQRMRIRSMAPRRDQQFAERVHVIENAGHDWEW